MTRQTVIRLIDDIDGGNADETLVFSYRGNDYEIDLSASNAEAFDKALEQFIVNARKNKSLSQRNSRKNSNIPPKVELAQIRDWASKNKIKVSQRGRIAADVISQYRAENS